MMTLNLNGLDAINAYGRIAPKPAAATDAGSDAPPAAAGFGAMIGNLVGETGAALKAAEQASSLQVAGRGDMIDVVTAIGAAETALDTMVAVRDKVVSAYGEIMRMQV